MKKSYMYQMAQIGVLNMAILTDREKLDIIKELQSQEQLSLMLEKRSEQGEGIECSETQEKI